MIRLSHNKVQKRGNNNYTLPHSSEKFKEYVKEVRAGAFPTDGHCYHMIKGEEAEFQELIKEYE
jgi:ketopantoate hydroxymethyltransferase